MYKLAGSHRFIRSMTACLSTAMYKSGVSDGQTKVIFGCIFIRLMASILPMSTPGIWTASIMSMSVNMVRIEMVLQACWLALDELLCVWAHARVPVLSLIHRKDKGTGRVVLTLEKATSKRMENK